MPETTQPARYETLIWVQVLSNRLAMLGSWLERLSGRLDGFVNDQLGVLEHGELKADDYSEIVSDEFWRCVKAREQALSGN